MHTLRPRLWLQPLLATIVAASALFIGGVGPLAPRPTSADVGQKVEVKNFTQDNADRLEVGFLIQSGSATNISNATVQATEPDCALETPSLVLLDLVPIGGDGNKDTVRVTWPTACVGPGHTVTLSITDAPPKKALIADRIQWFTNSSSKVEALNPQRFIFVNLGINKADELQVKFDKKRNDQNNLPGVTDVASAEVSGQPTPCPTASISIGGLDDMVTVKWNAKCVQSKGQVTLDVKDEIPRHQLLVRSSTWKNANEVIPTATPSEKVGGISSDLDLSALPLEAADSSGRSAGVLAGVIAAGAVALGGGALGAVWYARRRWR